MKLSEISIAEDSMPLFEMANLRSNRTGVVGTIYISTKNQHGTDVPHGFRIKWYAGRPSLSAPFAEIFGDPPDLEVRYRNNLSEDESSRGIREAKEWMLLNKDALLSFWNDGTSWFEEEVQAFKDGLKKI